MIVSVKTWRDRFDFKYKRRKREILSQLKLFEQDNNAIYYEIDLLKRQYKNNYGDKEFLSRMIDVLEKYNNPVSPFVPHSYYFLYYFPILLRGMNYAIQNRPTTAMKELLWLDDCHSFLLPYFKDRFIEILKLLCYNTPINLNGSTTMLNDFFNFFNKKDIYDKSSPLYGTNNINIPTVTWKDYDFTMRSIQNTIIDNDLVNDEQKKFLLDYASFVIAKDLQSHFAAFFIYDKTPPKIDFESGLPQYIFDEKGKEISLKLPEMKRIDLCKIPTFVIPENFIDLKDALTDINNNGFNTDDRNSIVYLYEPLNICVVSSGRHHISAGIASGSCIVDAYVIDLTKAFDFWNVEIDRCRVCLTYNSLVNNKKKSYVIPDGRIALLYQIAKLRNDLKVRMMNQTYETKNFTPEVTDRPNVQLSYLKNVDIVFVVFQRIKNLPADSIIDVDELTKDVVNAFFDYEMSEVAISLDKAIQKAKEAGLIKAALCYSVCYGRDKSDTYFFYSFEELEKFKENNLKKSSRLPLSFVLVRTKDIK